MNTLVLKSLYISLTLLVAASSGCYKLDIHQGNLIEQTAVERLQLGMSKRQVQQLLGTPLLSDPFNLQRWDYIYTFFPKGNSAQAERRHLSLFFDNDSLSRIEGDREPASEVDENSN